MAERPIEHSSERHSATRINRGKRTYISALGRLTGNALRQCEDTGRVPRRLQLLDRALSPRSKFPALSSEMRDQIAEAMKQTTYWHGTGRYQYRDGKVVDVLDSIARHQELQPSLDPFEVSGHMQSLSLARARIYARAYADLHRNPNISAERHGTSAFWSVVFLADYILEAARDEGGLGQVIKRLKQNGKDEWYTKVSQQPMSVFSTFAAGSDIAGNYPIIFGISAVATLPTSRAISLHEVRTGEPIKLSSQVTHIEVPNMRIAETEEVLSRYNITLPVYVLEDFERYAAMFPASRLMSQIAPNS